MGTTSSSPITSRKFKKQQNTENGGRVAISQKGEEEETFSDCQYHPPCSSSGAGRFRAMSDVAEIDNTSSVPIEASVESGSNSVTTSTGEVRKQPEPRTSTDNSQKEPAAAEEIRADEDTKNACLSKEAKEVSNDGKNKAANDRYIIPRKPSCTDIDGGNFSIPRKRPLTTNILTSANSPGTSTSPSGGGCGVEETPSSDLTNSNVMGPDGVSFGTSSATPNNGRDQSVLHVGDAGIPGGKEDRPQQRSMGNIDMKIPRKFSFNSHKKTSSSSDGMSQPTHRPLLSSYESLSTMSPSNKNTLISPDNVAATVSSAPAPADVPNATANLTSPNGTKRSVSFAANTGEAVRSTSDDVLKPHERTASNEEVLSNASLSTPPFKKQRTSMGGTGNAKVYKDGAKMEALPPVRASSTPSSYQYPSGNHYYYYGYYTSPYGTSPTTAYPATPPATGSSTKEKRREQQQDQHRQPEQQNDHHEGGAVDARSPYASASASATPVQTPDHQQNCQNVTVTEAQGSTPDDAEAASVPGADYYQQHPYPYGYAPPAPGYSAAAYGGGPYPPQQYGYHYPYHHPPPPPYQPYGYPHPPPYYQYPPSYPPSYYPHHHYPYQHEGQDVEDYPSGPQDMVQQQQSGGDQSQRRQEDEEGGRSAKTKSVESQREQQEQESSSSVLVVPSPPHVKRVFSPASHTTKTVDTAVDGEDRMVNVARDGMRSREDPASLVTTLNSIPLQLPIGSTTTITITTTSLQPPYPPLSPTNELDNFQNEEGKNSEEGAPDVESTPTDENIPGGKTCGDENAGEKALGNLNSPVVTWHERLYQLIQYKREHGDCNVPPDFAKNPELSSWVAEQRQEKQFLDQGKPSTLTKARLTSLKDVGFAWT